MNAPIRPALVVAVAFLPVAGFFGLLSAYDPMGLRLFIHEDRRHEQLQQIQRSTDRHDEARKQVVRELIAQRCSLSEVIARLQKVDREWLQEVDREWPNFAIGIGEAYHLTFSDADCYFRIIIQEAALLLRDRPEEAASVLRRLEKEHQQLRASRQTFAGWHQQTD